MVAAADGNESTIIADRDYAIGLACIGHECDTNWNDPATATSRPTSTSIVIIKSRTPDTATVKLALRTSHD